MAYGDGGGLEDRMAAFLATVPLDAIERELTRIAPGCAPHSMSVAQVVHTLGVAGIAALAGVRRSTVLQSAGPESCAIADLIAPNPWGHLVGAGSGSCGPCSCRAGFGPSVPSLGIPGGRAPYPGGYGAADGMDPGYYRGPEVTAQIPGGYVGPSMTPIGYARGEASTPIGYTGPAAPLGAPAGGATARYQAPAYSTRDDRAAAGPAMPLLHALVMPPAALARRNPGGLSPAQEAAINAALAQGASPEDVQVIHEEYQAANSAAGTGWPGAVPFRPDAWNFSEGWYILQSGDTFAGLAARYLDSPARWPEIWQLQPYRYSEAPDPSSAGPGRPLVAIGERVIMPQEATDNARKLYSSGAPRAPAIGGVGGTPKGAGAPWSTGTKVAIGVVALGALGLGAYAIS